MIRLLQAAGGVIMTQPDPFHDTLRRAFGSAELAGIVQYCHQASPAEVSSAVVRLIAQLRDDEVTLPGFAPHRACPGHPGECQPELHAAFNAMEAELNQSRATLARLSAAVARLRARSPDWQGGASPDELAGGLEHWLQRQPGNPGLSKLRDTPYSAADLAILLPDRLAQGQPFSILCCSLDHFAALRLRHGSVLAERLLTQLGQRLLSAGSHEQVIHLGQDEFAILSPQVDDAALHAARRVLQRVGVELRVDGERFALSASIGISQFPQDGEDGEALLLHARQAVTTARQAGGNSWARYCPEHTPAHQAREALENDLRLALGRPDEMHLHYQPIINFRTGQVVSMEALARWHHPRLGMVSPERFIPIAEESSLIIALGHRLLDTALRQWKTWQQAGLPAVPISVNLSARQLCKVDLHDDIAQLLARHQVPASMLQLEITETALAQAGLTPITRTLDALADMGICIALDDFGTGYANLQHLYRYRPDHIKIDRSFISHIGLDTNSELIVAALLGLSHNLQLGVVAEGVETLEQANWLWRHGCDVLQGFLFSRPLPATEMAAYLRDLPQSRAMCPLGERAPM